MKRLPRAFQQIASRDRRSKTDMAAAAGFDVSLISRLNGRGYEVSATALGKLTRAFPREEDRLALLEAWLLDKAEEAGFDPGQARAALGAEGDLVIPPVLRDTLRDLMETVVAVDAPMVGLLSSLRDCVCGQRRVAVDEVADFGEVAEDNGLDPRPALPPPRDVSYGLPRSRRAAETKPADKRGPGPRDPF